MRDLLTDLAILFPSRKRRAQFADALLGPKCPRCYERVFPGRDQAIHDKDCD